MSDIGGYAVGGLIVAALRAAGHQAACSLPHYTSTDTQIIVYTQCEADARSAVAKAIVDARGALGDLMRAGLQGGSDRPSGDPGEGDIDGTQGTGADHQS